jgi:hypothetical protein
MRLRLDDVYLDPEGRARWPDSSLESQVQQQLAIYADDHEIRTESIFADDTHAVVLTSESRSGDAGPKAWRAAHVWRYSHTQVKSLDIYVLSLSVRVPA